MKRWLIYGVIALAVVLLMKEENRPGTDVAKLEPARLMWVENVGGGVSLRTDMDHTGWGKNLEAAVQDMEMTAFGQVFLDTAEYLLISPDALRWLPELSELLRSSCQVCLADGVADLAAATEYLAAHKPDYALQDWRKGEKTLPVLYSIEERMYLAK